MEHQILKNEDGEMVVNSKSYGPHGSVEDLIGALGSKTKSCVTYAAPFNSFVIFLIVS